jgi:hypothetical protein
VPADATLSAGIKQTDGSWLLTTAELVGLTMTTSRDGVYTLAVEAVATETSTGEQATSNASMTVTVNPVADMPTLVTENVTGPERHELALPISAATFDTDGSEILSISITDVPDDAVLSAGVKQADGSWLLDPADLEGLTIRLAHEGSVTLTVTATATEVANGEQASATATVVVNAVNVDFYLVGSGPGLGTMWNLNLDGTIAETLQPFGPSYLGEVRVAVGDINGDGYDDMIAGAGPGGGPHVKVFDGRTGAELMSFFAFDSSFTGGITVAAGDLNGDGYDDVIVGAGQGGGPHVRAFDGKTGAELYSFFAYDPSFRGGINVAAGDVNGDGIADILTGAGIGGGPHVQIFDGSNLEILRSFMAYDVSLRDGVYVGAGNVVGDGRLDILTGAGPGGGPHVRVFDGHDLAELASFFAYAEDFTGGVRVGATDQDGDGLEELLMGPGDGGGPHLRIIERLDLSTLENMMVTDESYRGGLWVG